MGTVQYFYNEHILKPIHLRVIYNHSGCRWMLMPLEMLILKPLGNLEVLEVCHFNLKNTFTIQLDPLWKNPISTACLLIYLPSQTLPTVTVNWLSSTSSLLLLFISKIHMVKFLKYGEIRFENTGLEHQSCLLAF